jgi:hypothetical protein
MLGDGKRLIIQAVPSALLEFSRSIMRSTFSSIVHKRIYTLSFDRTSHADADLLSKLESCRRNRGVVISTPTSIKSLMLKYVEYLDCLCSGDVMMDGDVLQEVRILNQIMDMFQHGTLIMDEVDLLLHPLKSELNFPIGVKQLVDFEPHRFVGSFCIVGYVLICSSVGNCRFIFLMRSSMQNGRRCQLALKNLVVLSFFCNRSVHRISASLPLNFFRFGMSLMQASNVALYSMFLIWFF